MVYRRGIVIAAMTVVAVALTAPSYAQTNVGGVISGHVTWGPSGSPYTMTSTVEIHAGASLTILPGVTVRRVSGAIACYNGGQLFADGVRFTGEGIDDNGILYTYGSGSVMRVDNCTFEKLHTTRFGMHILGPASNIRVSNSTFTGFEDAIALKSNSNNSTLQVFDCEFRQCIYPVYVLTSGCAVSIVTSTFSGTTGSSVLITGASDVYVDGSVFDASPTANAIRMSVAGTCTITNSCFSNLGTAITNSTGVIISAADNWWGSPSGPSHSSNPGGTGEVIAGAVDFHPYADYDVCGTAGANGGILVYCTGDGTNNNYGKGLFDDGLVTILRNHGYRVNVTDRGLTPELSSSLLANYTQVWLFTTRYQAQPSDLLSASEVATISTFVNSGKGLFVMADDDNYNVQANQVTEPMGVRFSGSASRGGANYPQFSFHPVTTGLTEIYGYPTEGRFQTISAPATTLASLSAGSDAVIVAGSFGSGRAVFDPSFIRAFDGEASRSDHPQYFRNVADWLSGVTDLPSCPGESEWTQPYDTDDCTMGLWHLDGGGLQADDESGRGHHGTVGTTDGWTTGRFDGGLSGSSSHVLVPNHPDLNLRNGPFTVECWAQHNGNPGGFRYLIHKRIDKPGTDNGQYALYTGSGGGLTFFVSDAAGGNIARVDHPSALADVWDGRWHHIAGVYTGSELQMYVDGTVVAATSFSGALYSSSLYPLGIGDISSTTTPSTPHNFPGVIDEVRVSRGVREYAPQVFSYGTTVIVHGFKIGADNNDIEKEAGWTLSMARAVGTRVGRSVAYVIKNGSWAPSTENSIPAGNWNDPSAEQVIVFSWLPESDRWVFGYAEAAGDVLFANLLDGALNGFWDLSQLHIIAHSRGAIVASEAIQRLGMYSQSDGAIASGIDIDDSIHLTTLDPHPWDFTLVDCVADPLSAFDNWVNLGHPALTMPPRGVALWENVGYADNYRQGHCIYSDMILNGLKSFPGIPVSYDLTSLLPGRSFRGAFLTQQHSAVHAWYYGTINQQCTECADDGGALGPYEYFCNNGDGLEFDPCVWYPTDQQERYEQGFNYSRNFGALSAEPIAVYNQIPGFSDYSCDTDRVFNGNFALRDIATGLLPGWERQGGGGEGSARWGHLDLDNLKDSRIHNWQYIPKNATHVRLERRTRVPDIGNDWEVDELQILINDEVLESWPLNNESKRWIVEDVPIPPEKCGTMARIGFKQVTKQFDGISAKSSVDNVHFRINDDVLPSWLVLHVGSPVYIEITDPNNRRMSRGNTDIPFATYDVYPEESGDSAATIVIPNPIEGIYSISVNPWPTADGGDLFSIYGNWGESEFVIADNVEISEIPVAQYAVSTLDTGSVSGLVSASTGGLLGVAVSLYDEFGNWLAEDVTDADGAYGFFSLDNGTYSVSIVTPLGFVADSETKTVLVRGLPHEVDFALTKRPTTPNQRSRGYWANRLRKAMRGEPKEYTVEDFSRFAGLMAQHFNSNLLNSVDVYQVPQPATQTDSLDALYDLLKGGLACRDHDDKHRNKARSQLAALLLNVAAGRLSQTECIADDSATVSQAITYANYLINSDSLCLEFDGDENDGDDHGEAHDDDHAPSNKECLTLAKEIAEEINEGDVLERGMVPLYIVNIAYKDAVTSNETVPRTFNLYSNFPNPFNAGTVIRYDLADESDVQLDIFDVLGRRVVSLVNSRQPAGRHEIAWDGRDAHGRAVASGMYLYRLAAGSHVQSRKMVLLK